MNDLKKIINNNTLYDSMNDFSLEVNTEGRLESEAKVLKLLDHPNYSYRILESGRMLIFQSHTGEEELQYVWDVEGLDWKSIHKAAAKAKAEAMSVFDMNTFVSQLKTVLTVKSLDQAWKATHYTELEFEAIYEEAYKRKISF